MKLWIAINKTEDNINNDGKLYKLRGTSCARYSREDLKETYSEDKYIYVEVEIEDGQQVLPNSNDDVQKTIAELWKKVNCHYSEHEKLEARCKQPTSWALDEDLDKLWQRTDALEKKFNDTWMHNLPSKILGMAERLQVLENSDFNSLPDYCKNVLEQRDVLITRIEKLENMINGLDGIRNIWTCINELTGRLYNAEKENKELRKYIGECDHKRFIADENISTSIIQLNNRLTNLNQTSSGLA